MLVYVNGAQLWKTMQANGETERPVWLHDSYCYEISDSGTYVLHGDDGNGYPAYRTAVEDVEGFGSPKKSDSP